MKLSFQGKVKIHNCNIIYSCHNGIDQCPEWHKCDCCKDGVKNFFCPGLLNKYIIFLR